MGIIVDKEFQALIPPLSDDEFRQLEENCIRDGIRDPLVTWPQDDGTEILIDGHNRWKISAQNSGIPFKVERMKFKSRADAETWILKNQLGRRNLPSYIKAQLALKLKPIVAEKAEQRMKAGKYDPMLNSTQGSTRKELAKIANVGQDTIRKVEVIEKSAPEPIKEAARRGDISVNKAYQLTTQKPPAARMKDFIDETQQRHEEFKDSDSINIADVRQDKTDRKVLAGELFRRCMASGKPVSDLYFDCIETKRFNLREMSKELTPEQRESLRNAFVRLIANITELSMEVVED